MTDTANGGADPIAAWAAADPDEAVAMLHASQPKLFEGITVRLGT